MNIQQLKTILTHNYPLIELTYNKNNNTIKLENIEASMRFGMGYQWNIILYFEKQKLAKEEFECCTFDNSSVHFCKILEPPKQVKQKAKKVLQTLNLI